MKKKKILYIFNKMDRGGAELRTLELIKNMDSKKYEFYFCSLSGKKGELDKEINELGGKVVYCKLNSIFFPMNFIALLKKSQINIVHSNVYHFSGVILFLASLANIPNRIAHYRTIASGKKNSVLNKIKYFALKKLVLKYATAIIGVSKAALFENFSASIINDDRVMILYNGIDFPQLDGNKKRFINQDENLRNKFNLEQDSNLFVHVGRMNAAKNHLKLIEVFKNFYESINNSSYLFLIGKIDMTIYNKIYEVLQENNMADKVYCLGVQDNVYPYLIQGDCMIYPSIREGLPGVLIEALASGLPVVASDISPNVEVAEHFSLIRLVSLDQPTYRWAESINELLDVKKSMKHTEFNKGYKEFENSPFTVNAAVKQYTYLLENMKK